MSADGQQRRLRKRIHFATNCSALLQVAAQTKTSLGPRKQIVRHRAPASCGVCEKQKKSTAEVNIKREIERTVGQMMEQLPAETDEEGLKG